MDSIKLSFSEINPFIRYSHYFTIDSNTKFTDVVPYEYRLIYIVTGNSNIVIDHISYPANSNSLFIIPPGITYSYLINDNQFMRAYGINFDYTCNNSYKVNPISPDKTTVFSPEDIVELVHFTDNDYFNKVIYIKNFDIIEPQLHKINWGFNSKKNYYALKIKSYFISLIVETARNLSSTNVESVNNNALVDTIIQYIQDNYQAELSNQFIGEIFNFNPTYISRLFIKHTGLSLHKYIVRCRLLNAMNLLQTTNYSITQISDSTGFSDVNYFTKAFKKYFGSPPKKYQ